MELKVTNKRLDTRPIGRRLTQGESLVDRPRIVLQKTYEGLDISGYSYEIRAVSDKDTLVRRPLDKTVEGDKLILLWTVTAEFTAVSGPLALTIVGMDEAGNEIIKITSDKIIIREDPEGAWTAPPPDVLNDALRQMAILQNAAVAAKNAAEAAQRAAEAAQDAARESETAAAVSAAGAEASKDQTDDIREDTAGIKAEAEKVLEDRHPSGGGGGGRPHRQGQTVRRVSKSDCLWPKGVVSDPGGPQGSLPNRGGWLVGGGWHHRYHLGLGQRQRGLGGQPYGHRYGQIPSVGPAGEQAPRPLHLHLQRRGSCLFPCPPGC